ncbi:glutamine-hydrolyzing carbamoyl-phosphate synthase small subunit [Limnochorda pilosa]|uniref:Carbamoyl phosphate synthase small chain n=1 Tax=Limnochorda pilosa TaxID=1555112 RepID=A0A0K2SJY9_LIMPI|nr:glutamine-hydrolyzing carbamoyl-phosphate synthase small subunit [Limnochorda pilosa]BAS27415.1 carbamoyl phosphate synthase small subunit [Limnochorda pilosa]
MEGWLVLENGAVFRGEAVGAEGRRSGEVVFNTGMTGYQEMLTDPSYRGQILAMTYPLIGNYGATADDLEADAPQVEGLVVHRLTERPSSWRSDEGLATFLREHGVVALAGVDTRALTRLLREEGTLRGVLATGAADPEELKAEATAFRMPPTNRLVEEATVKEPVRLGDGSPRVVAVDLGAKRRISQLLLKRGAGVVVVPPFSGPEAILVHRPDGVLFSNGPGDPAELGPAVATARALVGRVPLFGICLGEQVLAQALGARTFKLKYGHRGGNHPVQDLVTGQVAVTTQNHGYAVEEGSWDDPDLVVTHRHLNDGTVEGIMHRRYPLFAVQYHPEGAPGPEDSHVLFDRFVQAMAG